MTPEELQKQLKDGKISQAEYNAKLLELMGGLTPAQREVADKKAAIAMDAFKQGELKKKYGNLAKSDVDKAEARLKAEAAIAGKTPEEFSKLDQFAQFKAASAGRAEIEKARVAGTDAAGAASKERVASMVASDKYKALLASRDTAAAKLAADKEAFAKSKARKVPGQAKDLVDKSGKVIGSIRTAYGFEKQGQEDLKKLRAELRAKHGFKDDGTGFQNRADEVAYNKEYDQKRMGTVAKANDQFIQKRADGRPVAGGPNAKADKGSDVADLSLVPTNTGFVSSVKGTDGVTRDVLVRGHNFQGDRLVQSAYRENSTGAGPAGGTIDITPAGAKEGERLSVGTIAPTIGSAAGFAASANGRPAASGPATLGRAGDQSMLLASQPAPTNLSGLTSSTGHQPSGIWAAGTAANTAGQQFAQGSLPAPFALGPSTNVAVNNAPEGAAFKAVVGGPTGPLTPVVGPTPVRVGALNNVPITPVANEVPPTGAQVAANAAKYVGWQAAKNNALFSPGMTAASVGPTASAFGTSAGRFAGVAKSVGSTALAAGQSVAGAINRTAVPWATDVVSEVAGIGAPSETDKLAAAKLAQLQLKQEAARSARKKI